MHKLLTALVATSTILLAGSIVGKAEAATATDVGSLAPLTKSYAPVEEVGYRRRHYRRGYYGYGYRPYGYYGYGYRPYGYYGYGYRPYGYYGYGRRWRY
jgi:hypothetical protein